MKKLGALAVILVLSGGCTAAQMRDWQNFANTMNALQPALPYYRRGYAPPQYQPPPALIQPYPPAVRIIPPYKPYVPSFKRHGVRGLY